MTTLILVTPYLAFVCGAAMMARALHLWEKEVRRNCGPSHGGKFALLAGMILTAPTLAHAQVDLRTATESGNAIIMYLSGTFAAVGIVSAGVAMMLGRQSIAKWAFVGAMVCGLGFAIVRTVWSNMGMEASGVGSFAP